MTVAIVLRIDPFASWLRRAESTLLSNARQTLGQSVALALYLARTTTAFTDRTGKLRRSLGRGQKGPWHHFLRATAKHALYVEKDTKAHPIVARKAKALRFVQAGQIRFAKSVWHPGTKGTHFLQRSAEAAEVTLLRDMEAAVARAVQG